MKKLFSAVLAAALCVLPAIGQVTDGTNGSYVPAGGTGTLNFFGTCIVVTNSSSKNVQFMYGDQASWNTFLAHPAPGVTYSACGGTTCPNQTVSWSVSGNSCSAAFSKKGNGNTETVTATAGSNGSVGNGSALASCNSGVVTLSSETCSTPAPPPPPTGCTDGSGNPVADGGTWTTSGPSTEACFLINSAYTGGTANCTTTNHWLCNNGSAQLQSKSNACDTSTCTNSAGGNCIPLTQADCNNTSVYPPNPLDEWTAAHNGPGGVNNAQVCWIAFEFAAHLVYALSSNECSCTPSVHVDNQINSESIDCTAPPNSTPPPSLVSPNCPNVSATCIP